MLNASKMGVFRQDFDETKYISFLIKMANSGIKSTILSKQNLVLDLFAMKSI